MIFYTLFRICFTSLFIYLLKSTIYNVLKAFYRVRYIQTVFCMAVSSPCLVWACMRLYGVLWLAVSGCIGCRFFLRSVLVKVSRAYKVRCDTLLVFRRCRGCIGLVLRSGVSLVSLSCVPSWSPIAI